MPAHSAVLGRRPERQEVADFVASADPALVLTGSPGIGKTTLWETAVRHAREDGARVLVVRSGGAAAWLPFAALTDLCEGLDTSALPPPQRHALEVALLRTAPCDAPPGPGAIVLGFLNLLRAVSAEAPVVVAIDDIQWLDAPSAEALAFAARRLDAARVRFLLARRQGRRTALELALEPGVRWVELGPLALDDLREVLSVRLGLSLSRPLLRRIADATLGNPLHALEIGRSLLVEGLPVDPEELPLPDAVEDALGTRVDRLAPGARRLLLAAALSPDLRRAELAALAGEAAVDDAVDEGLLRLDDTRVRPSHPLLAAAARKRSRAAERRAVHRELATVVGSRSLRALHLAHAATGPDEDLAGTLTAAAHAAPRAAHASTRSRSRGTRSGSPRRDPHATRGC